MKFIDLLENASSYNKDVSIVLIITIKECYQTHVLNIFIIIVTERVFVKKSRQIIKRIDYA
jgi:hypothetical protein